MSPDQSRASRPAEDALQLLLVVHGSILCPSGGGQALSGTSSGFEEVAGQEGTESASHQLHDALQDSDGGLLQCMTRVCRGHQGL